MELPHERFAAQIGVESSSSGRLMGGERIFPLRWWI